MTEDYWFQRVKGIGFSFTGIVWPSYNIVRADERVRPMTEALDCFLSNTPGGPLVGDGPALQPVVWSKRLVSVQTRHILHVMWSYSGLYILWPLQASVYLAHIERERETESRLWIFKLSEEMHVQNGSGPDGSPWVLSVRHARQVSEGYQKDEIQSRSLVIVMVWLWQNTSCYI